MANAAQQETLIDEFQGITGADGERARFYLESAEWDVNMALAKFYQEDEVSASRQRKLEKIKNQTVDRDRMFSTFNRAKKDKADYLKGREAWVTRQKKKPSLPIKKLKDDETTREVRRWLRLRVGGITNDQEAARVSQLKKEIKSEQKEARATVKKLLKTQERQEEDEEEDVEERSMWLRGKAFLKAADPKAFPKKFFARTTIKIKEADGNLLVESFWHDQAFLAIIQFYSSHRTDNTSRPFQLAKAYPRRMILASEYAFTLDDLDLSPTALLIVVYKETKRVADEAPQALKKAKTVDDDKAEGEEDEEEEGKQGGGGEGGSA